MDWAHDLAGNFMAHLASLLGPFMGIWHVPDIGWAHVFFYLNLLASPLNLMSKCYIALYGLGFIFRFASTSLVWYCSQRIRFQLKKSSRIISEEFHTHYSSFISSVAGSSFPVCSIRVLSSGYHLHRLQSESSQSHLHPEIKI